MGGAEHEASVRAEDSAGGCSVSRGERCGGPESVGREGKSSTGGTHGPC